MQDYITNAYLETTESRTRLILHTTDGIAKIGLSPTEVIEPLIELLPLMQNALITSWVINAASKHIYISFKKDDYHKFIEFDYDYELPLEPDQLAGLS